MPEPVSNTEIEDVLSSIRRLVSEDPSSGRRRKSAPAAETNRLVLTPAQRVKEVAFKNRPVSEATPAWKPDPNDNPDMSSFAEMPAKPRQAVEEDVEGDAGSLEDRVAGLEAALMQSGGDWEPDGSEDGSTDNTRPLSADADFDMAEAWEREIAGDDDVEEPETSDEDLPETGATGDAGTGPSGLEEDAASDGVGATERSESALFELHEDTDLSELLESGLARPVSKLIADANKPAEAERDTGSKASGRVEDREDPAGAVPRPGTLLEKAAMRRPARRLPNAMAVDLSAVESILADTTLSRAIPRPVSTARPGPATPAETGDAPVADRSGAGPSPEETTPKEIAAAPEDTGIGAPGPAVAAEPSDEDAYRALEQRLTNAVANLPGVGQSAGDAAEATSEEETAAASEPEATEPEAEEPQSGVLSAEVLAEENRPEPEVGASDGAEEADPAARDEAGATVMSDLREVAAERDDPSEADDGLLQLPEIAPDDAATGSQDMADGTGHDSAEERADVAEPARGVIGAGDEASDFPVEDAAAEGSVVTDAETPAEPVSAAEPEAAERETAAPTEPEAGMESDTEAVEALVAAVGAAVSEDGGTGVDDSARTDDRDNPDAAESVSAETGPSDPAGDNAAADWEDWADDHDQAGPVNLYHGEEGVLDEDALKDLVTQIVREELQGQLGERITRNVRRLVRREIERALAMRDLD